MSVTDELLANNEAYAADFDGPLPLPPAKGVAVVACMDAGSTSTGSWASRGRPRHPQRRRGRDRRRDPVAGDQPRLGTREIVLIHHTDCGMLTFDDEEFRDSIEADAGTAHVVVGGVPDLDQDVRDSVHASPGARTCPTPTRSAASSSTSRPGACARWPDPPPTASAGRPGSSAHADAARGVVTSGSAGTPDSSASRSSGQSVPSTWSHP